MADASEDTLLQPSTLQNEDDNDPNDEVQDFRFFSSKKLPSRGTKDFEPHGTNLQLNVLDASRDAMYSALDQTRYHQPNNPTQATFDPKYGGAWVLNPSGKWTATVGRSRRDGNNVSRLWLLPEEALWLIERGSLHIRWPAEAGEGEDEGLPMSLQGAYAAFVGFDKPNFLSLEMFTVYSHLKRAGYVVLRADENRHNVPVSGSPTHGLAVSKLWPVFAQLWNVLRVEKDSATRFAFGPLVKPGLYRNYGLRIGNHIDRITIADPYLDQMFSILMCIPFHDPHETPKTLPPREGELNVTYHIYKNVTDFKKSAPGPPDFYISVVNKRNTFLPNEPALETLLQQTPYHPPGSGQTLSRKLKGGYRNVILAVVDQGAISFINVSDAGFGCEKLWGRPKRGAASKGSGKRNGKFSGRKGR
jgi:tRNA-splicing endonuclease subunit Sen54